jgi:ABC-type bacteriocin/lantibiotic exporter with double-glycine peptidase domain
LDPTEARKVELATYGVESNSEVTRGFVPDRGPVATLIAILADAPFAMVYVLLAAVLALVPAIAVPMLVRVFVNRTLLGGDSSWSMPVLLGLIGSTVVATALVVVQYTVLRRFALRLSRLGQIGFAWHVLGMRIPTVERIGLGSLVARLNARQRMSFQGGALLPLAGVNVINAVAYLVVLFLLDFWMGIAGLVVSLAMFAASLGVLRWRRAVQSRADDGFAELSGTTADIIGSIETIKAAAWEQFAFSRWAKIRAAAALDINRLGVGNQWLALTPTVALAVGMGLVLAIGCLQVIDGRLSLGSLIAAQSFIAMLLTSVGMLIYMGTLLQSIISAARQADGVLSEPLDPEVVRPGEAVEARVSERLTGEVHLRGITFGYDPDSEPLLTDLDLRIPAGSRVALVGRSGSGKTTIAKLAVGELRPWAGEVLLDGVTRLRVPRATLTTSVAYVPQQVVLFPGTIRDNLTLWNDDVSDETIRRAAADACIDQTILARPGGFHAEVTSQDSGFSGGEMQRLSIARALVTEPSVLVLDEATSALDPVVEAEVDANLRRRGCTCLIVAHRLSTVRDADEILVIEGGRVVQRGPYEDLKTHGFFAELIHG